MDWYEVQTTAGEVHTTASEEISEEAANALAEIFPLA